MATWVPAGRFIIDTAFDDPAWSGQTGYTYAGKVRLKEARLGAGSDAPATYRWAFATSIMISTPSTFSSNNQTITQSNSARRVFIIVDAWTDRPAGDAELTVKELEWRLERLT